MEIREIYVTWDLTLVARALCNVGGDRYQPFLKQ